MSKLKRFAAPPVYPLERKTKKFAPVVKGGGHASELAIPLRVVLRDMLKYAKNAKEAKKIVTAGKIAVDGVVRKEDRFGVGLMDVISIPELKKHYRILPAKKRFVLIEIPEKESKVKLCRIDNKTVVKGGHIQLNLHDGRNILIKVKDPRQPKEDVYKTRDSLLISLPDSKIMQHIKMENGKLALVAKGKLAGKIGKIKEIKITKGVEPNKITMEIDGKDVSTRMDYVFVVGDDKPAITINMH